MLPLYHIHLEECESTNTWAKENCSDFPEDTLTLVTADAQTKGRGRRGRGWLSPPKQNIYASYVWQLPELREDVGNIPQLLSISAVQVLRGLGFGSSMVQWPNDIIITEKKIGGVLSETTPIGKSVFIIVGLGLNINMTQKETIRIDQPATSLLIEGEEERDVDTILYQISDLFRRHLAKFLTEGFSPFYPIYFSLSKPLHTLMRFHHRDEIITGIYEGYTPQGGLKLRVDGEPRIFYAGEVWT